MEKQTAERLSLRQYRGTATQQLQRPGAILSGLVARPLANLEIDPCEGRRGVHISEVIIFEVTIFEAIIFEVIIRRTWFGIVSSVRGGRLGVRA